MSFSLEFFGDLFDDCIQKKLRVNSLKIAENTALNTPN